MRFMLISGDQVVNVIQWDGVSPYDPGCEMLAADQLPDGAGVGWTRDGGGTWSAPPEPDPVPEPATPGRVTRYQAKMALDQAGLIGPVEATVQSLGGPVLIAWTDAPEFLRDSPFIASLRAQIGLTDAQIDALFVQAATF